MSVEQPDPEPETVLVSSNSSNGPTLHVPADTADEGDNQPLCHTTRAHDTRWMPRPLDVYPPAWRTWCKGCLNQVRNGRWP